MLRKNFLERSPSVINTIDTQLIIDRQGERLANARAYRLARLARGRARGGSLGSAADSRRPC
jgi:hypothetical protein